jgi:heterodisulfide reductase subunit C2
MIATTFQSRVDALAHETTELCYHCHKCTAGCPVSYAMSYGPDRILRMVQLGQADVALGCQDIWLCAGCETCGARCPNDIDIAHVMDALRQISQAERRVAVRRVPLFHRIFLFLVLLTGQMHEAALLGAYKVLAFDLFSDLGAGAQLILKGKVPIVPKLSKNRARVRRVFAASVNFTTETRRSRRV